MKKFPVIVLVFIFVWALPADAQIDKLKERIDEHEQQKKDNEEENDEDEEDWVDYEDDDESFGQWLAGELIGGLFRFTFRVVGGSLVSHHQYMMHSRDLYPLALSLDIMTLAAVSPTQQIANIQPRLRGNWGVLSTDLRMNQYIDYQDDNYNTLRAWEWQILQLNLNWSPRFSTRIGTGIHKISMANSTYSEHSLDIEWHTAPRLAVALGGRLSYDYSDAAPQRDIFKEANVRAELKAIETAGFRAYFNAGLVYQDYFAGYVDFTTFLAGFRFVLY